MAWIPLYLLQGGTVMWDARGDHYNQAALELPKHQVDAIRCNSNIVPFMHMTIQPCTVSIHQLVYHVMLDACFDIMSSDWMVLSWVAHYDWLRAGTTMLTNS